MFLEIHHLNALIRDLDEYFHMQIRHLENKKRAIAKHLPRS